MDQHHGKGLSSRLSRFHEEWSHLFPLCACRSIPMQAVIRARRMVAGQGCPLLHSYHSSWGGHTQWASSMSAYSTSNQRLSEVLLESFDCTGSSLDGIFVLGNQILTIQRNGQHFHQKLANHIEIAENSPK